MNYESTHVYQLGRIQPDRFSFLQSVLSALMVRLQLSFFGVLARLTHLVLSTFRIVFMVLSVRLFARVKAYGWVVLVTKCEES